MKRRVTFRQCDLERAIRAAKATGADPVMVRPDATIIIDPEPLDPARRNDRLAEPRGVVL